jgi:hypothetical protein
VLVCKALADILAGHGPSSHVRDELSGAWTTLIWCLGITLGFEPGLARNGNVSIE